MFIPESHVPWILFGIAVAVILGLIIFMLVICRRHGSARQYLCPATQKKDSKQPESVPSLLAYPDVHPEPEYERTDIIQYESLGEKVGRPPSRSVVTLNGPLFKFFSTIL